MKSLKKADLYIALIILISAFIISVPFFFQKDGGSVRIEYSDKVSEYSLSEDSEYLIETEKGSLYLVIEDGKAFVKDSTCPDKVCEKCGKISKKGETIVCVPSGIVVGITGKESENDEIAG